MSEELEEALRAVEARKRGLYEQRTHHKDAAGNPLFINRLIREDSPYLLQHAHNPVNWFSWGEQAFAAAAEQDPVPVRLGNRAVAGVEVIRRLLRIADGDGPRQVDGDSDLGSCRIMACKNPIVGAAPSSVEIDIFPAAG